MKKAEKGFVVKQIYEEIKHRIVKLDLKPGEVLNDKQLMIELGVGRTPIREVILMLKKENLIVGLPNKSAYVREISLKDFKDLTECLIGIEKLTAPMAASRITPFALKEIIKIEKNFEAAVKNNDFDGIVSKNREFHVLIAKASDNRYLFDINGNLRNEAMRMSYLAVRRDFENNPKLLNEHYGKMVDYHRQFITALKEKNIKQIEKLVAEHIRMFQERIALYLSGYLT